VVIKPQLQLQPLSLEAEASRQPSIPEWPMRPFIDNIGIVGIIA
jgi:hypothetical protein